MLNKTGTQDHLLRWSAITVCLGLGLTGLLHDLPLRTLVWDTNWWQWFATLLGYEWTDWVTSESVDQKINLVTRLMGGLALLSGLLIIFRKWMLQAVILVSVFLLLQHFLLWKEHFWSLGHLLELSLQTGAPLLFFWWHKLSLTNADKSRFWRVVRILTAMTFVGHGLYAAGYHPVPANFVLMTQAGLGVGEATARNLLFTVGILDFLAAGLLLLPYRRSWIIALCWIIPWALLTTFARFWSYGGLVEMHTLLTQWGPEVLRRGPHVLVPLALFLYVRE
jgi:hypothetical protein